MGYEDHTINRVVRKAVPEHLTFKGRTEEQETIHVKTSWKSVSSC